MATNSFFGGMLGKAEGTVKSRKEQLDEAERKAMGESAPADKSPNKQPDNSKGEARPPQSKKWYE